MENKQIIEAEAARKFCIKVLKSINQPSEEAEIVADTLIEAELRGVGSHGLIRFPHYVERMVNGATKINPNITKTKENVSTVALDGDEGMGQIVAYRAMEEAIAKAKETGVGFVTANHSGHFGAGAYYAMQALDHDMIGVVWSNVTNVMAPWGGSSREIGNNPLSVAVPAGEYKPIVLDMAMSKVAGGKVRVAEKEGKKIPDDWIISKDGTPTKNPEDLPNGGALMALGYKGYGLAIIGEVLAGVLSDSKLLGNIPVWFKKINEPTNIGHMTMAINIESFLDISEFKERVDYIIKTLKSSPTAEGYEEILMPGEPEFRNKEKSEGKIELSIEIIKDLDDLADKYDIEKISKKK